MSEMLIEQYKNLGISEEVYRYGAKIEERLKDRFKEIDERAEFNQMKVIRAMQENRVSAECFNSTSGYGYNDMGRDTLEKVYASCFKGEDALVRPQITCGTHALALALMSNLRPGDELLSPVGKPYDTLEEAIYIIKRETRHFAKRQLTWFRRESDVIWFDKQEYNHSEEAILADMMKILADKEIIL